MGATNTALPSDQIVENLKTRNAELTAEVADLKAKLDQMGKEPSLIDGLKQQLDQANATIGRLQTENKASDEASLAIIDELKRQLVEAQETPSQHPTITFGKDTYQVTQPEGFTFKGQVVTLADLKKDEALVATLVKRQSSYLVKVEKKK